MATIQMVDSFLGAAFEADATDAPPAYFDEQGNLFVHTNEGLQLAATAADVDRFEGMGADVGAIIGALAQGVGTAVPGIIQGASGKPAPPKPAQAPDAGKPAGGGGGGFIEQAKPYLPYAAGALALLLLVRYLKKRKRRG